MDKVSSELLIQIKATLATKKDELESDGYAKVIGTSSYIVRKAGPATPRTGPGNISLTIDETEYLFAPAIAK